MAHSITALTKDKARLIVKQATIINDVSMAEVIRATWEREGYIVLFRAELG